MPVEKKLKKKISAGYKQHIYECLVLLYRFIYSFNLVCEAETLLEVLSVKYGNRYSSV